MYLISVDTVCCVPVCINIHFIVSGHYYEVMLTVISDGYCY